MIRSMEAPVAQRFQARTVRWAQNREDVLGILLVGSWARGTARADSDLDLMVLVDVSARPELKGQASRA